MRVRLHGPLHVHLHGHPDVRPGVTMITKDF